MSPAASRVYNLLISQGVADTRARVIADTVDAELAENRRAAEQCADEAAAESKKSDVRKRVSLWERGLRIINRLLVAVFIILLYAAVLKYLLGF